MEYSNECCIGCMPDHPYGDYLYFNNSIDTPKEHHNHLFSNQEEKFYITSLSKLMYDTFTSLHKLFVD